MVLYRSHTGKITPPEPVTLICGTYFTAAAAILNKEDVVSFREDVGLLERRCRRGRETVTVLDLRWYHNITLSPSLNKDPVDDHANYYLAVFESLSRLGLVDAIMQKESEGPTTSLRQLLTTSDSAKTTRKQMLAVLLSVDDAMIHACITRQVARHAHMRSHPTKHELKENMELAANIPGQYISIICDKIGLPMTNRQCAQVVDDIALYLRGGPDSDKIAVAIDMVQTTQSWPITRTHEGLRKYTDFTKVTVYNTCEKDLAHRSIVDRFLTDLRPQIQDGPDYDKPRPVPFVEVGFSDQIYLRLQQHSSHTNSNYLMNLFHAAVENRFGGIFKLHQEVLSLCSEPADAWLGEIAFTQLCKGYVTEASGFSHSGAGLSIGNFYERLPAEIWDTMYLHGARTEKIERNLQKEEEIARVRHFAEPGAHQRFEDEILKDIESVEQISRTLQSLEELRQIDQEIKELLEST